MYVINKLAITIIESDRANVCDFAPDEGVVLAGANGPVVAEDIPLLALPAVIAATLVTLAISGASDAVGSSKLVYSLVYEAYSGAAVGRATASAVRVGRYHEVHLAITGCSGCM